MSGAKIYAARHGETELNAQNRVCGATDLPLTQVGIEQARSLAKLLSEREVALIFCSDMLRARQTAEIVGELLKISPTADCRLREMNFGGLEGCSRYDGEFNRRKQVFAERFPVGGESILQGAHRVYGFLDEILEKYPDKNILIVSHGWTNKFIATYFGDLSNEEFAGFVLPNCGYAEYDVTNLCKSAGL